MEVQSAFQVGAVQADREVGRLAAAWILGSQVGDSPNILSLEVVQDAVEMNMGTPGRQVVVLPREDTANVEDAWNAAGCDPPNLLGDLLEALHRAACVEVAFRRVGHMAAAVLGTWEEMACFDGRIDTCSSGDR